ncbi:MAG TPA: hypothetical protein VM368_09390, partial [Flavisolibacter sp.]|nr:hypothetical protein [Flavisolibacter sp.]
EQEKNILKQLAAIVMDEMEMRLRLRNTVHNIKKLSTDIAVNLRTTSKNIKELPEEQQNQKLLSYLDASQMFLANIENQLKLL